MKKTTIYLPEELKARVARVATDEATSEAAVIRTALDEYTARRRPRPRPLFNSGRGDLAERFDELLAEGFGRD